MSSDLESEIRDALRSRAMSLTANDLGRDESQPRRRTMLAALVAAAVVAAVAIGIGIGIAAWPRSGEDKESPASPANVIGIDWRLTTVVDKRGTHDVARACPSSITATSCRRTRPGLPIVFRHDGTYIADDGLNSIEGRYQVMRDRIEMFAAGGSLVGGEGTAPLAQRAMDAITFGSAGHVNALQLGADVDDGMLVLRVPGYTLEFRNAGTLTTVRLRG